MKKLVVGCQSVGLLDIPKEKKMANNLALIYSIIFFSVLHFPHTFWYTIWVFRRKIIKTKWSSHEYHIFLCEIREEYFNMEISWRWSPTSQFFFMWQNIIIQLDMSFGFEDTSFWLLSLLCHVTKKSVIYIFNNKSDRIGNFRNCLVFLISYIHKLGIFKVEIACHQFE